MTVDEPMSARIPRDNGISGTFLIVLKTLYAGVQTAGFPGRQGRISRPCRAELYGQCSISVRSFDYDGIAGR